MSSKKIWFISALLNALFWSPLGLYELWGQGDASFVTHEYFLAGRNPLSVTTADFNGDAFADLAVANWDSNNVSVLLGRGDGTFEAPRHFAVGRGPNFILAGDFNRDGLTDLVIACGGEPEHPGATLTVLLGAGDGTFGEAMNIGVGFSPSSMALDDFNGDGIPDLAVTLSGQAAATGTVAVLLGNGDGSFQLPQNYTVGIEPSSVATGDFNSDGITDLAVANFSDPSYRGGGTTVSILLGIGDGTFGPPRNFEIDEWRGRGPISIVAADFNGDGLSDLAVATVQGTSLFVLLGKGDGTFQLSASLRLSARPHTVVATDFNRDGIQDLAVTTAHTNSISIFFGIGDGTFGSPINLAVGRPLYGLAVGDFNSDSSPDIAAADFGSNSVSIHLGNAAGTFQSAPTLEVGNLPVSVVVGDFNRDGHQDFAVLDQGTSALAFYTGNGDGTFQTASNSTMEGSIRAVADFNRDDMSDLIVSRASSPPFADLSIRLSNGDGTFRTVYSLQGLISSFAIMDLNGDAIPDLAVVFFTDGPPLRPERLSILLGNGDGTFRTTYSFEGAIYSFAYADFNGDCVQDLAVVISGDEPPYSPERMFILLGQGEGVFRSAHSFAVEARIVSTQDFNGDSIADLLLATRDSLLVLLGNGDGTFAPAQPLRVRSPLLTIADLNGDGYPDLAVIADVYAHPNQLSIYFNQGDGTFKPFDKFEIDDFPSDLLSGDFNGDGITDLVLVYGYDGPYPYQGAVLIRLGNGDGSFGPAQYVAVGPRPGSISLTDINGDGIQDIVTAKSDLRFFDPGTVSIVLGNRDGVFRLSQNLMFEQWSVTAAVADFNGDGIPDLAVNSYATFHVSRHFIVLGNREGTFPTGQFLQVQRYPSSVKMGDFNNDGIPDLVVTNAGADKLLVLLGNGDRTFRSAQTIKIQSAPWSAAIGDFNNDTIPDLAVIDGTMKLHILLGKGDGTFSSPQHFELGFDPGAIVAGDFNGDHYQDLAITDWRSNSVQILKGNGDGTFQAKQTFPVGKRPWSITVGDFNKDGILDLVTANRDSNDVSILLGKGNGNFLPAKSFDTGMKPVAVVVGDFNGDDRPDLAVANWDSNSVSILAGKGDGTFSPSQEFGVGLTPSSLAVGDFNNDGRVDLVVTNWGGHNVTLLINNTPRR
ncbi:MAG: VCBS repeat-containing protein [Acidobacteria bacterium]|nr:VCBS repeat-containing protein [Acidobacteriota bacterium]